MGLAEGFAVVVSADPVFVEEMHRKAAVALCAQ